MHFPIPSNFCLLVFCRLGILSALCGCKRSVFSLVRWYPFFGTLAKFKRKIIFWSSGRTRWNEEHFSSGMLQLHPHMKRASVDPCCSPFGIFITTKWKILKRDLLAIFTYTHTNTESRACVFHSTENCSLPNPRFPQSGTHHCSTSTVWGDRWTFPVKWYYMMIPGWGPRYCRELLTAMAIWQQKIAAVYDESSVNCKSFYK